MLEVLSDTVIYFVLYAFIGWISEVIYAAYEEKRFVNRGVLAGPICNQARNSACICKCGFGGCGYHGS